MILIFGGTTEGRLAVSVCEEAGKTFYYSTKSGFQDIEMHNGVRLSGAMSSDEIQKFCEEHHVKCIIDAAHPFAENLHREVSKVSIPVIRVDRQKGVVFGEYRSSKQPISHFAKRQDAICYCNDYADAISKLNEGNIQLLLALSGANTISKLKPYWQSHNTVFRILNREESVEVAKRNDFPLDNLIYYNDSLSLPSVDDELRLLKSVGCDAIITKDSGTSGGFEAKVEAALQLGLKVFVVKAPKLPYDWTFVTGKYGLRRSIENIVPQFFPLKTGFTTGACATAATKAALISILEDTLPEEVHFALPDGEIMTIPVECNEKGIASVVKDFSDDPDVTKGCRITSSVSVLETQNGDVSFLKGNGVGVVTLPGLGIPVGEPAVNQTPRQMMSDEIHQLTDHDVEVSISVENGEELAKRTFNYKVGVVGGISIIGTSGIVHPLSNEAFVQSIRRELSVARAIGKEDIGLVAGMKSEEALHREIPDLRCIHYGNFIGESLKVANELGFKSVVLAIMTGKAVKLAEGHLDTHSHKVQMNKEFLVEVALSIPHFTEKYGNPTDIIQSITMARELNDIMPQEFFDRIEQLCLKACQSVFPHNIKIKLICENKR